MAEATDNPQVGGGPVDRVLRIAVFVALAVATVVVIWALTEGGERDLWIEAASGLDTAHGWV